MSDDPTPREPQAAPRLSDKGRERVADRRTRQAEALRANLRRRKEQLRARAEPLPPDEPKTD